jgi:hypothetical protein
MAADLNAAVAVLADLAPPQAGAGLHPAVAGLLANHAFNLLWGGVFAMLAGALLNWRNDRAGYWANLAVVSGFDLGFLLFIVAPGHIGLAGWLPGPVLWIIAAILTTIGRISVPRAGAIVTS